MSKSVAIYCRISNTEQTSGNFNTKEQELLLRKFCEDNNYSVFKVYTDEGFSCKSIENRPAMREMLKDANDKKFDIVITCKINRIARTMPNLIKILGLLEKNSITFKSLSENFETETAMGKFTFQMMGAISNIEKEMRKSKNG